MITLRPFSNDDCYKVYALFFLETLQTAMSGADLYYWFVTGFGNMDHLNSPHLSGIDVPIMGSMVSLIVQLFFAYRVWVLSFKKSWWLCMIICIVSLSLISGPGSTTYSSHKSQCAIVDTAGAFAAGIYVSSLCHMLSVRLMIADECKQGVPARRDT